MQITYSRQDEQGKLVPPNYRHEWSQVANKPKFMVSLSNQGGGITGDQIQVPEGVAK
jgi:hypothetical protein